MNKRIRYRARRRTKIKFRTLLLAGSIAFGFVSSGILLTLQLLENEPSAAGADPMVIDRMEVFQDTTSILKGTSNQLIIGIRIQTKGRTHHLNLSALEVAARGTTKPYGALIFNARLWYTGNNDFFIPAKQLGPTLTDIPDENFTFTTQQKLLYGSNYFWVTFDVTGTPGSRSSFIDAECISARIGTLTYEPDRSAPPGAHRVINNIPYYSSANGDISSLESWNSQRDGAGKRLTSFNLPGATFHIQSGHILRNKLNGCVPYLVVERNGVLVSSSAIKSEHLEIQSGGTVIQQTPIQNAHCLRDFIIENGGNYIHKNTGAIPGETKTFGILSNVILNAYSEKTFEEVIQWGNLIIDNDSADHTDFRNGFRDVRGNLEIRATGDQRYLYSSESDTINIGGDLIINGGRMAIAPTGNLAVINIAREFQLRKGTFCDALPFKASKGSIELYPGKRVFLKGGSLVLTGKYSRIQLDEEMISWIQDTAHVLLPDVNVLPGCTLNLSGNTFGELDAGRTMTISGTAAIACGTTAVTGEGTFRLEPNGTLETGHAEGIHSEAYAGSVQCAKRFFSSSANYMYSGSNTPQKTGEFKTQPAPNTVNRFIVSKNPVNTVLILQQDFTVTGNVIRKGGSINKNSFLFEDEDAATATAMP